MDSDYDNSLLRWTLYKVVTGTVLSRQTPVTIFSLNSSRTNILWRNTEME